VRWNGRLRCSGLGTLSRQGATLTHPQSSLPTVRIGQHGLAQGQAWSGLVRHGTPIARMLVTSRRLALDSTPKRRSKALSYTLPTLDTRETALVIGLHYSYGRCSFV
jgi:hypothetical protein